MKNLSFVALLAFAISCSDSSEFYAKNRKNAAPAESGSASDKPLATSIIATPDQLIGSPVVVDEGLVIVTNEGEPKPATVEISNIDPTSIYTVEYHLEKEDAITRVAVPNNEVPTKDEIKPNSTLKIPVIFKPAPNSVVTIDQVVITYTKKDDPTDIRTIIYPVRGEVIKKPVPVVVVAPKPIIVPVERISPKPVSPSVTPIKIPELVITVIPKPIVKVPESAVADPRPEVVIEADPSTVRITTISGQPIQDFGTTVIGKPIETRIVVTNTSKEDIKIEPKTDKDDSFHVKDPEVCPRILKKDESCTLIVTFDTKIPGTHQDDLVIEHRSPKDDEPRITKIPLIAIKIEDLETCDDKPCGKPFKEGTLISSEVFSNDIDFGSVSVGTVIKKQVEIQNKGDIALKVKAHKLDGQSVFSFTGGEYPGEKGTCSDILRPGSCVVEISYRPLDVRSDLGSFSMSSDEGPSVKLKITGQGSTKKSCDSTNEYLVVPEKSYPAASVTFPYLKTKTGTNSKLSQLYGMQVNSFVPEIKEHTVKDGMVYITFKLPAMEGEIISMNFGVNVYKVIRDNFKDTESLCLSSSPIRKCSGHEFSLDSWQKLKNPNFWNQLNKPVNDLYEKQLLSGENKCGSKDCMSLNTRYELKDIFNLSTEEFQAIRDQGIFTLIFSDDTRMLTMPRIAVKTKIKKECN